MRKVTLVFLMLSLAAAAVAQRSQVDLTSLAKAASAPSKMFVTNSSSITAWTDAAGFFTPGTGISISGNTITATSGLPAGSANQTLRYNGSAWAATSNMANNGTSVVVTNADASTSAASTANFENFVIKNSNSTNNNWSAYSSQNSGNTIDGALAFRHTDHTNANGYASIFTRSAGAFLEVVKFDQTATEFNFPTVFNHNTTFAGSRTSTHNGTEIFNNGFTVNTISPTFNVPLTLGSTSSTSFLKVFNGDANTSPAQTDGYTAIRIINRNTTTGNWSAVQWDRDDGFISADIAAQHVDRTNGYADIAFHARGPAGFQEIARFTNTLRFGLGTTAPSQLLDVNGAARFRGVIYDGTNSAGTSGQVLTSAGSGSPAVWGTPSTGASTSATYITQAAEASLSAERVATAGNNITITDGGANSTLTIAEGTQNIAFPGDISPTSISSTNNDYNPTGLSTASTIRQDCSANAAVTGIAGGADGRVLIFHNISTTNTMSFREDNASSTAANRLLLGGVDVSVRPGGSATFRYDATSSRWRLISLTTPSVQALLVEYTTAQASTGLNVPKGAKWAHIVCVGAGGGGGSGRKGAAGSDRAGGGGGAAGGYSSVFYSLAGDLTALYVTVGAGGAGGTAVSATNTNGNNGTQGGTTCVSTGSGCGIGSSSVCVADGGLPGLGGTTTTGTGGNANTLTDFVVQPGASASVTFGNGSAPTDSPNKCPGSGGSGGGINSSNTAGTGGNGGKGFYACQSGGIAGGNATSVSDNKHTGGGGGGGDASAAGAGSAGGAGRRGGGGGGGGASSNSANSGAGGAGADGYVSITFGF